MAFWLIILIFPLSSKEKLSILGIGNSFTNNAYMYLGDISDASETHDLFLGRATIGGCSLEKHHNLMKMNELDSSKGKYYTYKKRDPQTSKTVSVKNESLKFALKDHQWDIVTLQQLSSLSTEVSSYQPYLNDLIAFVKKHAPQAKIMMHQTWAYRIDGDFDKVWPDKAGYNQNDMYRDSSNAYKFYCEELKLDLIPVGAAFQLAREARPYVPVEIGNLVYKKDKLPKQPNSLCVGYKWNKKNGTVGMDSHHANQLGCLLAGLVWFEKITEQDATALKLDKVKMSSDSKNFYKKIAHDVVTVGNRVDIKY